MTYGFCYDPYDSGWGGRAQPGAIALRDGIRQRLPAVGDLGILRDRSRCGKRSAHCHGRAWDPRIAPSDVELGDALAEFFIKPEVVQALGIQRVIWGFGPARPPKEWDSRPGQRFWSSYSGHHHDDHVHVELCWEAAKTLTKQMVLDAFDRYWKEEEDDLPYEREELKSIFREVLDEDIEPKWASLFKAGSIRGLLYKALFKKTHKDETFPYTEHPERLDNMLTAIGEELGITFAPDGNKNPDDDSD